MHNRKPAQPSASAEQPFPSFSKWRESNYLNRWAFGWAKENGTEFGRPVENDEIENAYAVAYTLHLQQQVEQLKNWKDSAMSVMGLIDNNAVSKLLDLKLGDSVYAAIVPGIERLQSTVRTLREALQRLNRAAAALSIADASHRGHVTCNAPFPNHEWAMLGDAMVQADLALLTPPPTQKGENDR